MGAKLERIPKISDADIWLNSRVQLESIGESCKYSQVDDFIDRFYASIGRRSGFFRKIFEAHIQMRTITLPQLSEQYSLCEATLKRFENIGARDLDDFTPSVSLATAHQKSRELKNENCNKGKGNLRFYIELNMVI